MTPQEIVNRMYQGDAFSQWLGIERVEESAGHCILKMTVREEMTNGFGIAHGGITYSLADSALAFASNGYGNQSVSIETSISHTKAVGTGDIITAVAVELSKTHKVGVYDIKIHNQENELVAIFKGTVYISSKSWE
jgi:acyl-CoA thioesterase